MKINKYGSHQIFNDDIKSVIKVLKSDFLTQGKLVTQFENEFSKKVNCKFSIAVNSGTSALHLACLALNLNENDIFWTTPISFVASANCGIMVGAKVDFVDIDINTGNISIDSLKKKLSLAKKNSQLPKVIIVVHYSGNAVDIREISKLSKKYKFKIIEDGCHALGGKVHNTHVGSCKYSHITTFSFHPVKNITSAEGGMITTNNSKIKKSLELMRTHGIKKFSNYYKYKNKIKKGWFYEQRILGYNYRLSDIHAALGLNQLKRLNYFVKKRNKLAKIYEENINQNKYLLLTKNNFSYSGMHILVIRIIDKKLSRAKIIKFLKSKDIGYQIHYQPIHLQPFYKKFGFKSGNFPIAEKFAKEVLTLPLHTLLEKKEILKIIEYLNKL